MKIGKKLTSVLVAAGLVWNAKSMIMAETRPLADQFPDKTIIIGTHAVALEVLNDEILEIALKSAENNMQNKIYFKSDINKGVWYDITDSDSIANISTSTNNIVKNQSINELNLQYYTKSSGVTVSFITNSSVYVSDINSVVYPVNMEECKELVNELSIQQGLYESVKEAPKNSKGKDDETDNEKYDRLKKKAIYQSKIDSLNRVLAPIYNNYVSSLTSQIHSAESLVTYLIGNGAAQDKIDLAVSKKMELKNTRDAYCYQIVIDRMNYENTILDYEDCNDLIQKYASAITNLQSKISELGVSTQAVSSADENDTSIDDTYKDVTDTQEAQTELTALEQMEQDSLNDMLELAASGNLEEAVKSLDNAYTAQSIMNNDKNVSDDIKQKQKEIIQQSLDLAKEGASQIVREGAGEDYSSAKEKGENKAVLDNIKQERIDLLKNKLSQIDELYQNLIDSCDKANEKVKLIEEKEKLYDDLLELNKSSDIEQDIKDILQEKLNTSQNDINDIKLNAMPEYQSLNDFIQNTQAEVEALNEKYLEAVEENQSEKAAEYKKQMNNALKDLINAENSMENLQTAFANGEIDVDLSTEEEKQKQISDSLISKDNELQALVEAVKEGDLQKVLQGIESLAAEDTGLFDKAGTLEKVKQLLNDSKAGIEEALNEANNQAQTENSNQIKETLEQALDLKTAQLNLLEDYTQKINDIENNYADRLSKENNLFNKSDLLQNEKQDYNKLSGDIEEDIKNSASENIPLLEKIDSMIKEKNDGLQKELDGLLNQIEAQTDALLGDKEMLSAGNAELAQQQEQKYSDKEIADIAALCDSLENQYKDYDFIKPWLLIFKDYSVKLKIPAMKSGEDIYVPAEDLAQQMGAELIKSKENNILIIKDKGVIIEYKLNDNTVYVNDRRMSLSVAPVQIIYNKTYLALQCFEKAYGLEENNYSEYTVISKK